MKNQNFSGFLRVMASMITFEEFKLHILAYEPYESEQEILTFIETGGAFNVFLKHSTWYRRRSHQLIIDIVENLCRYIVTYGTIPDTMHQALSDGSEEYQDFNILKNIWAVSETWRL